MKIPTAIMFAALAASACPAAAQDNTVRPPKGWSMQQVERANAALMSWLECEECQAGELKRVVGLGQPIVPTLAAVLKQGPSPASRASAEAHLRTTYRELIEYRRRNKQPELPMSEEQYVKTYLDNYEALHRLRAAEALGLIGGPAARKALEEAAQTNLRSDVGAQVKNSLARFKQ